MKRSEISVVMAVYNDADRVMRAVASLQQQTFVDFECIIINDGSTDSTQDTLTALAKDDGRFRIISQPNQGLTLSLITGCNAASGEYIARHDADDWSEPTRLQRQRELFDTDPRIGFVSSYVRYVGPNDEPLLVMERSVDFERATYRLLNEREGPPAHGSVMFRKALYDQVGGYRPEFYYSQDSDLWLRMAEKAHIAYVADTLYNHRREQGSISGKQRPVQAAFGQLSQQARQRRLSGQPEDDILQQAAALKHDVLAGTMAGGNIDALNVSYLLGSQLVLNSDIRARDYLKSVIRQRPWHLKAWVRLTQSYTQSWRFHRN